MASPAIALLFALAAATGAARAGESTAAAPTGPWTPPAGLLQQRLWPGDAPDLVASTHPESTIAVRKTPGREWTAVADVSVPTLTFFPPRGANSGAAVVVFPGGGFNVLAIDLEGTEICDWIASRGMTCVLLKYRVPGSNEHWSHELRRRVTPPVATSLQDSQRAIRLVRARAGALGVDPARIGVIGFSAGGYLVAQVSHRPPAYAPVDAADALSSRPDFAIALYPGHLCRDGGTFDPTLAIAADAPPTLLIHARDDDVDDPCHSTLYAAALEAAGVPVRLQLYATGGHAFGLRAGAGEPVAAWPALAEAWLVERGVLAAPGAPR